MRHYRYVLRTTPYWLLMAIVIRDVRRRAMFLPRIVRSGHVRSTSSHRSSSIVQHRPTSSTIVTSSVQTGTGMSRRIDMSRHESTMFDDEMRRSFVPFAIVHGCWSRWTIVVVVTMFISSLMSVESSPASPGRPSPSFRSFPWVASSLLVDESLFPAWVQLSAVDPVVFYKKSKWIVISRSFILDAWTPTDRYVRHLPAIPHLPHLPALQPSSQTMSLISISWYSDVRCRRILVIRHRPVYGRWIQYQIVLPAIRPGSFITTHPPVSATCNVAQIKIGIIDEHHLVTSLPGLRSEQSPFTLVNRPGWSWMSWLIDHIFYIVSWISHQHHSIITIYQSLAFWHDFVRCHRVEGIDPAICDVYVVWSAQMAQMTVDTANVTSEDVDVEDQSITRSQSRMSSKMSSMSIWVYETYMSLPVTNINIKPIKIMSPACPACTSMSQLYIVHSSSTHPIILILLPILPWRFNVNHRIDSSTVQNEIDWMRIVHNGSNGQQWVNWS